MQVKKKVTGFFQRGLFPAVGIFWSLALFSACAANTPSVIPAPRTVAIKNVPPERFEQRLAVLINEERRQHRLPPLAYSSRLAKIAEGHCVDMARNAFFSHTNRQGQGPEERINQFGYPWRAYGENIGCGQDSPEKILARWMESPPHRDNILAGDFSEIGIGFIRGGDCRIYWTALFASPRS